MLAITPFRLRLSSLSKSVIVVESGVLNRAVNIRELGDSADLPNSRSKKSASQTIPKQTAATFIVQRASHRYHRATLSVADRKADAQQSVFFKRSCRRHEPGALFCRDEERTG